MEIMIRVDRPFLAYINSEAIKLALNTALHLLKSPPTAISVVITNNQTVQQFNRQFRGIDAPTDVLSFTNEPDPDFPPVDETAAGYLGDVIIAYPIAKEQAKQSKHEPMEEVILLAVHGTLHLLGFDHDTPARKKEMWSTQQQIMQALNLGHIQPTESSHD